MQVSQSILHVVPQPSRAFQQSVNRALGAGQNKNTCSRYSPSFPVGWPRKLHGSRTTMVGHGADFDEHRFSQLSRFGGLDLGRPARDSLANLVSSPKLQLGFSPNSHLCAPISEWTHGRPSLCSPGINETTVAVDGVPSTAKPATLTRRLMMSESRQIPLQGRANGVNTTTKCRLRVG